MAERSSTGTPSTIRIVVVEAISLIARSPSNAPQPAVLEVLGNAQVDATDQSAWRNGPCSREDHGGVADGLGSRHLRSPRWEDSLLE
jgi:hypothetical protein